MTKPKTEREVIYGRLDALEQRNRNLSDRIAKLEAAEKDDWLGHPAPEAPQAPADPSPNGGGIRRCRRATDADRERVTNAYLALQQIHGDTKTTWAYAQEISRQLRADDFQFQPNTIHSWLVAAGAPKDGTKGHEARAALQAKRQGASS